MDWLSAGAAAAVAADAPGDIVRLGHLAAVATDRPCRDRNTLPVALAAREGIGLALPIARLARPPGIEPLRVRAGRVRQAVRPQRIVGRPAISVPAVRVMLHRANRPIDLKSLRAARSREPVGGRILAAGPLRLNWMTS
jgi:hypothetical protein